jgi:F0F1-type ATP synthase assembly protein I
VSGWVGKVALKARMGGLAKTMPTIYMAWFLGGINHANYIHGMVLVVGLAI